MSKHTATIIFGILVILVPFSGFPRSWKTFLLVVFGVAIVLLSHFGRRALKHTLNLSQNE